MKKFLIAVFAVVFVAPFSAENAAAQERFELGEACSYFGEETPEHVHTFASSKEAEDVIKDIMSESGLPQNFEVLSAGVPNAAAVVRGDKRFILYSRYFMHDVKQKTGNEWAPVSIMAHEIGHHLAGHTLQEGGSRPMTELEADKFSGAVLQKMGASLDDALAAMEALASPKGSDTHPAKRDRLEAIAAGWEESCARDSVCNGERSASVDKTPPPDEPKPNVNNNAPITEDDFKKAWEADDPEIVRQAIARGEDINHRSDEGGTLLIAAAFADKIRIIHALLDGGANPNLAGQNDSTPLMLASVAGNLSAVKALLQADAYADAVESEAGFSALHFAAKEGHRGVVKALLNGGANPDLAARESGITPLMLAAISDHPSVVQEFIAAGARLNLIDQNGRTARDHAKPFSDISGMLRRAGGVCNVRVCL